MASLQLVIILLPYWLCQATILPNLAGNILLTRLESPYDAPGDAIIPYGSTVTIESGTTLRFPRRSQLIIRGTLLAKVNFRKKNLIKINVLLHFQGYTRSKNCFY